MDELYLWAVNNGSSSAEITIWFDDDRTFQPGFTKNQNVIVTLYLEQVKPGRDGQRGASCNSVRKPDA